jgi:GNAT superfamily N-acetyltransferase
MLKIKNNVYQISSKEDDGLFWSKMGRFFASKEIRKEFNGYPLNDSDDHIWFVTLDRNENVTAFLGVSFEKIDKNEGWITEMYTLPDYRQKGLAAKLLSTAIESLQENDNIHYIKVVAHPESYSHNLFKNNKFKVESTKGAYTYYSKKLR